MGLIQQIEELGYKVHKGFVYGESSTAEKILDFQTSSPYEPNYGRFCVENPEGKVINIHGKLDTRVSIGGKINTTKEDILRALYQPTEKEWFICNHGYSIELEKEFQKAYERVGMIEYQIDEDDSFMLSEENAEKISTPWINAEGECLIHKDGKFIIQFVVRADIDTWVNYQFTFNKNPTIEDMNSAYEIQELKRKLRLKEISEDVASYRLSRIGEEND